MKRKKNQALCCAAIMAGRIWRTSQVASWVTGVGCRFHTFTTHHTAWAIKDLLNEKNAEKIRPKLKLRLVIFLIKMFARINIHHLLN